MPSPAKAQTKAKEDFVEDELEEEIYEELMAISKGALDWASQWRSWELTLMYL